MLIGYISWWFHKQERLKKINQLSRKFKTDTGLSSRLRLFQADSQRYNILFSAIKLAVFTCPQLEIHGFKSVDVWNHNSYTKLQRLNTLIH